jgi:NitT/TauT family transport system ATP-binding protein
VTDVVTVAETRAAPTRTDIVLRVDALSKAYGAGEKRHLVLSDLSLEVPRGSFTCIVGQSGTGKTTLLRCMAGLLAPTSGAVYLDDELVDRPPAKLALVFQDYSRSLLPWYTVIKNVMLPLRGKGIDRAEQKRRSRAALEAVGLGNATEKYPWQLSGGMQQRAAIARALAYEPEALLMDEPFASVDAQTRADLEDMTLGLKEKFGMTIIFVTHDIDEAVYLSDEVVVVGGSPAAVIERIAIPFGGARDQVETKALPEFAEHRGHILQLIRAQPRLGSQTE